MRSTNTDHDTKPMTDTNTDDDASDDEGVLRRRVLASAVGVAAAGAAGVSFAAGTASADPSGTFPVDSDPPLTKIRADRIRFVPRTSDPSSPAGGTMWVVE